MRELWADPDGALRLASERNWAPGGVCDVMIEKLWAPGGACRLMVEDPNSAFWTGMARGIARRRAATEARWAEQRKAHAATGFGGNIDQHETDFAGVRWQHSGFMVTVCVGGGSTVHMTYHDVNVAALAYDIALIACGLGPCNYACNYPKRGTRIAVPPPTAVIEEMMRRAAGGGPRTQVSIRETVKQYSVRWVVAMTLAREKARIRETVVLDELAELRTRTGVLTDDVSAAIAARVDALDYERMLGDQLRAEGFAEPPGDERAAKRAKHDA